MVGGRMMKNPLRKRLPRELKQDFGKYVVIFLFMTLTIGFTSGFLVAGGSMMQSYDESFEKYNIEDGHFVLDDSIKDFQKKRIEKADVTLEEDFYKEEKADSDQDGTADSTIRIYHGRDTINRLCLMKGEYPKDKNEIALDRMYAENNDLQPGDRIEVGGRQLSICGLVAFSDYSALFADNNDSMFDAVKFCVAYMTGDGYETFPEEHQSYAYVWKYNTSPDSDVEEREMADEFMETLLRCLASSGADVKNVLPRYANQAICFTGDDMGGDRTIMLALLYILIVIMAFVFSVTIRNTITSEAAVIGTLRASGYTKGEILRHYLSVPLIVTVLAALVGNISGYTYFKDMVAGMYYASYSLPTYVTIWNAEAFFLTTVIPILLMMITNALSLVQVLQLSPLKFLRRDLKRSQNKKAVRLPEFRFFTRFRIRIILQNRPSYITLFVGLVFSSVLLLYGMMMPPLFEHYEEQILENMLAEYQYVLEYPAETELSTAEKYCMTSLNYQGKERDEDIRVYGIEKQSRYVNETMPRDGVCISDGYAKKYQIKTGDDITLREVNGKKEYSFRVEKIMEYSAGLAVFMDRDQFNKVFDMKIEELELAATNPVLFLKQTLSSEKMEYFTGYFSDQVITDISDKCIQTCITKEDLTKVSRQMEVSMGSMFRVLNVFAVVMAALLIYLLTKLILEKNRNSISMVKILGYGNIEIAKLYLVATTWVVMISMVLGIGISIGVITLLYRKIMMGLNGWLTLYIAPEKFFEMFIMVLAAYGVVALLQLRKIGKIPMDEALKNVE